jgi:hypothetical protein
MLVYARIELAFFFTLCSVVLCASELQLQRKSRDVWQVTINTAGSWSLVLGQDNMIPVNLDRHTRLGPIAVLMLSSDRQLFRTVIFARHCDNEQFHRLKLYLDCC